MLYNIAESRFYFSISRLFSSNVPVWPYFSSLWSGGSSYKFPRECRVTAIIEFVFTFQGCAIGCTYRKTVVSHHKFSQINPFLTGTAIKKTRNRICSEKRLNSLKSDKSIEDVVDMGEEQPRPADYNQSTHMPEENNETVQYLAPSTDSEESVVSHRKRYAINETLAPELGVFGKKADKKEVYYETSGTRRNGVSKKVFLTHIRHLSDRREICRSVIRKSLAE